jgi:hypothetical protein
MTALTANTPEELYQAIGKFLQSNYSRENLVKMYDDARKCAASFRGIYSVLPVLSARKSDPLDGLQYIMDWSKEASKVVDDIASNLEQQTISEVTSQLKKIRGFADSVLSLVDTKLKEQAQKEARAKVEKEYKNLNDKVSRLKLEKMLLIDQENILGELQLEEQEILRRETKEIVQIYLSKDPTFKDRLSQLNSEINEMLETLNKLVGSNTPTRKLLDIYCKLKDIPLRQQFDDVRYAYCPIDDLTDVICSGCNRLYTSVDNVIKTFEEIQMKAEQQIDETPPQTDLAKNGALERIKKEVDKTDQECLQEIIEVLKNFWEDKDFEAAELALPPIAKTYDILCRSRGQCGAKTTNIIKWLGSAANDGSGYCPALLNELASPEVIADLEQWQEQPTETEPGNKDAKSEGEGGFIDNTKPTIKKLLSKNFIKATIKHLPYCGSYLFDIIYGVNGINAPKRENKSTNIVELLKKDYLLKTEDNLKQKIAKIAQDFTSRHLANTTACINAQLQVHFEYNNKLIDHIIESLKQNHAATPLDKFKDKLLTVVDEQYKKLPSFANSRLVDAGLAQLSMFKEYEREINNKKQKAKQTVEATCAIFEKQKAAPEDKRDGKKEYEGRTIRVPKPWYKKIWVKIIGGLGVLVLITTLLLNLKSIKEWFYSPRIETSTPIEMQLSLTKENKLSVTLKEICKDIDSRPLAQRSDTAKQYVGIRIEEERLKLLDINKNPKGDIYLLSMVFPDQSDTSYSTGRRILCDIPKEQHPELNLAKQGVELYISGQIKEAGAKYIELSDVLLKFD